MEQTYFNVEYIFYLIYTLFFTGRTVVDPNTFFATEFYTSLVTIWNIFTLILTLVTLIILTIFVYSALQLKKIRDEEKEFLEGAVMVSDEQEQYEPTRWDRIETIFLQGGESGWRQAILEADIMLDDMLTAQGYDGVSVGEKLKMVEPADFPTLDYAWAAHKVRNKIAHEGQLYTLTEREAKQTLDWYKKVFDNFYFS